MLKPNYTKLTFLLILIGLLANCAGNRKLSTLDSADLKVEKLSANTYVHISYLDTESFGKVRCNGMIFVKNREAIIFDTPATMEASRSLIEWLKNQEIDIKMIVPGHFHVDCVAGLPVFHEMGIPSYANELTIRLARENRGPVPQHPIIKEKHFFIGGEVVIAFFPGAGHTIDNIVGYIPSEKALFGGCLLKALTAGMGNLADADTTAWSGTIMGIRKKYPDIKYVVPGHGACGDQALLNYTIEMFQDQK